MDATKPLENVTLDRFVGEEKIETGLVVILKLVKKYFQLVEVAFGNIVDKLADFTGSQLTAVVLNNLNDVTFVTLDE